MTCPVCCATKRLMIQQFWITAFVAWESLVMELHAIAASDCRIRLESETTIG